MSVVVRDADVARNAPVLQRFILGSNTYEAQFTSDRRLDADVGKDFLPELVRSATTKQGRIFVAEEGGVILGWAVCFVGQEETYVRPDERPYGYVAELFVEEAARGRHVGRTLLNSCGGPLSRAGPERRAYRRFEREHARRERLSRRRIC